MEYKPIVFGDFMKMGADASDRIYEDLTDLNKLKNILNDVGVVFLFCCLFFIPEEICTL